MRFLRSITAIAKPNAAGRASRSGGWQRLLPLAPLRAVAVAAVLIIALGVGIGVSVGVVGFAGNQPSTSVALRSLLQSDGAVIVFSEFGETADTIWAADPDDPSNRTELGSIEHTLGYGIVPSLAPDGSRVAYLVLPAGTPGGGLTTNAELWVLETKSGKTNRLGKGLDLIAAPVWSPASDAVISRRGFWSEAAPGSFELVRFDVGGQETSVVAAGDVFPIDFSPGGDWFYYGGNSEQGTDLVRVPVAGGEPEIVAHIADRSARNWSMSPDGTQISFLGETDGSVEVAFQVRVLDLETGEVRTPLPRGDIAQFNPVWDPEGGLTVGQSGTASDYSAPLRLPAAGRVEVRPLPLPQPPSTGRGGFDVPLSWSPDGEQLVVRSFEGGSAAISGPSWLYLVGTDGTRHRLSPQSDVIVAGWLEVLR